ncbi:MAG TPA: hypothetical protein VGH74_01995 [Planctomycetaceae bacterium]|jgi:hypothetical protein
MDDRKPSASQTLIAVTLNIAAYFVIGSAIAIALYIPEVLAVPAGILFIWLTVRWSNRRDDPRQAKRPSDPP